MPFDYNPARKCFLDPEQGRLPYIHWAGCEWPTLLRPEIFLRYRTLGMSEREQTRYRRKFYYRRFRANLKQSLQKIPWLTGWLAKRDEHLRKKNAKPLALTK